MAERMNHRKFVRQVATASTGQLSQILTTTDPEQQQALANMFGKKGLAKLRPLAQKCQEQDEVEKETIFLLPGITGSELWLDTEEIWLDVLSILAGSFERLHVSPGGMSEDPIAVTSVLFLYTGLELRLAAQWKVVKFPYDWRLKIEDAATGLKKVVDRNLPAGARTRFVTHSMGGLVVRSMLQQYGASEKNRLERLIMIGVPNFGTFAIPRLYSGLDDQLKMIALAERKSVDELLQWIRYFVGTYQMIPFVGHHPDADRLLEPVTYGKLDPPQDRFITAITLQNNLNADLTTLPLDRLTSIVGYGHPTAFRVKDWNHLEDRKSYQYTREGDGNIAHSLGMIPDVTNYYSPARHEFLPADDDVMEAADDILRTGSTTRLPDKLPALLPLPQLLLQAIQTIDALWTICRFKLLQPDVRKESHADAYGFTVAQSKLKHLLYCGHHSGLRGF